VQRFNLMQKSRTGDEKILWGMKIRFTPQFKKNRPTSDAFFGRKKCLQECTHIARRKKNREGEFCHTQVGAILMVVKKRQEQETITE
jgi:hypothetical protein